MLQCPRCGRPLITFRGSEIYGKALCPNCGWVDIKASKYSAIRHTTILEDLLKVLYYERKLAEREAIYSLSSEVIEAEAEGGLAIALLKDKIEVEPGEPVGVVYDETIQQLGTVLYTDGDELVVELADPNLGYVLTREGARIAPYIEILSLDLQIKILEERDKQGSKAYDLFTRDINYRPVREGGSRSNLINQSMDPSQQKAVQNALELGDGELLLVWGPPGSGKTHVIAEIARILAQRGEKVLIASHTNIAVENAIDRVCRNNSSLAFKVVNKSILLQGGFKTTCSLGEDLERELNEARKIREYIAKHLQSIRELKTYPINLHLVELT
ncbi:AAA domain-containing protein [Thermogladius sp. 4427co]|uniref:AAA domain-containing protein n=1 Tax=Thermogladius sp. 4427co TaxID=3450718 RepID=UPI003F793A53